MVLKENVVNNNNNNNIGLLFIFLVLTQLFELIPVKSFLSFLQNISPFCRLITLKVFPKTVSTIIFWIHYLSDLVANVFVNYSFLFMSSIKNLRFIILRLLNWFVVMDFTSRNWCWILWDFDFEILPICHLKNETKTDKQTYTQVCFRQPPC